jgi:hypothetical protein
MQAEPPLTMKLNEILRQLYAERDRIDHAIVSLERWAQSGATPLGEPPPLKPRRPAEKPKERVAGSGTVTPTDADKS